MIKLTYKEFETKLKEAGFVSKVQFVQCDFYLPLRLYRHCKE